jgi:23S rRNA (guanosine2251-2'-O)-methyltransferase
MEAPNLNKGKFPVDQKGKRARKTPDRTRRERPDTVWLFGLHAVREALENPLRDKIQLILTKNASDRLGEVVARSGMTPTIVDPRKFSVPIDPQSVHQGAAIEVKPLNWGSVSELCAVRRNDNPIVLLLDRVSDPHNVGAILRSAEVFGARAVIAPRRHSAPETGALAKAASGALERQPYLQVPNLARSMSALLEMGYKIFGLDGEAEASLEDALHVHGAGPIALALGSEGPGLRALTKETCTELVRITASGGFGSLNVSNAAAVALYAAQKSRK